MSDEAVEVFNYRTGNKIFKPDTSVGLSNKDIVEILTLLGLQVSEEIYNRMSPMLKLHFKETKPFILEHPAYKD